MGSECAVIIDPGTECCTLSGNPLTNWPGDPLIACGEPSIAAVTFACVHEHIGKPRACAACAAEIQQCAGFLICPFCEDGPEAHECPCSVVIAWDDETAPDTIVQETRDGI